MLCPNFVLNLSGSNRSYLPSKHQAKVFSCFQREKTSYVSKILSKIGRRPMEIRRNSDALAWCPNPYFLLLRNKFICNKSKGRISKRVFQENKAHQIFWKTNISYPLIRTRTCPYQGVRNRFEICSFALLTMN